MITDEQIEIAFDEIAKELVSRGLKPQQVTERLRNEVCRIESELHEKAA